MSQELLEQCTVLVDQKYPHATGDLFALLVADELFNQLLTQAVKAPQHVFSTLYGARMRVNQLIKEHLSEPPVPKGWDHVDA